MPRFYWDFAQAKSYLEKTPAQTPWTPVVSVFFAFAVAMDMIMKEGIENVFARHARVAQAARDGVKSLGLPLFAEENHASNTVTAVKAPEGLDANKLRQILREEYQVVLAGGQQTMAGKIFRIGHLGWVTEKDIEIVLSALKKALPQAGFKGG